MFRKMEMPFLPGSRSLNDIVIHQEIVAQASGQHEYVKDFVGAEKRMTHIPGSQLLGIENASRCIGQSSQEQQKKSGGGKDDK